MSKNYYELLGLEPDASEDEIVEAGKRQQQDLQQALSTLTDADKRTAYDQNLIPMTPDTPEPLPEQAQDLSHEDVDLEETKQPPELLRKIRFLAVAEGISLLVLLGIAMPLKYYAGISMAVFVVGSIHGILFVLYLVYLLFGKFALPLPLGFTLLGILASIIPFAPFFVDKKLQQYA